MDVPERPRCRELTMRLAQAEARILALEAVIRDLQEKLKPPPPPRPIASHTKPGDRGLAFYRCSTPCGVIVIGTPRFLRMPPGESPCSTPCGVIVIGTPST